RRGTLQRAPTDHLVSEVLRWMVYDRYWSNLNSGPTVNLENDAIFMGRLMELLGSDDLAGAFDEAVSYYLSSISAGELEAEYSDRHRQSLTAVANAAEDPSVAEFVRSLLLRLDALLAA
ncbi:MAG: hypothetical protein HQ478_14430, partial [Chloroflexi bacterium]|nr:hypothetical protein [Chloroflexota bacterium]